jgi:hypothetical protein
MVGMSGFDFLLAATPGVTTSCHTVLPPSKVDGSQLHIDWSTFDHSADDYRDHDAGIRFPNDPALPTPFDDDLRASLGLEDKAVAQDGAVDGSMQWLAL